MRQCTKICLRHPLGTDQRYSLGVNGPVVMRSSKTMGELCLDDGKLSRLGGNAEVMYLETWPLTHSATGLANADRLRKSSSQQASHPVDVG